MAGNDVSEKQEGTSSPDLARSEATAGGSEAGRTLGQDERAALDADPLGQDMPDPLEAPLVDGAPPPAFEAAPNNVEPAWGPATDFGVPLYPPPLDPNELGLDLLLDIPLQVSVELGRTRLTVSEILSLRVGSVLELDKMAGEPGDVLVNGTLIARGEVVVVDEKFGIRIVEVLPAARRLASVA